MTAYDHDVPAVPVVGDERVRRALDGLGFPADRAEVVDHAASDTTDAFLLDVLRALPDRTFSTADDVVISVP